MKYPAILLLLVALMGCGGAELEYTDHSQDPEAFALMIKRVTLNMLEEAESTREPADPLSGIVSTLDRALSNPRTPVGDYQQVYQEILDTTRPVYEACDAADGRTPDLKARLADIKSIAEQLPGEVKTDAEQRRS